MSEAVGINSNKKAPIRHTGTKFGLSCPACSEELVVYQQKPDEIACPNVTCGSVYDW